MVFLKNLIAILIIILPWTIRRKILIVFWKYELDPTSRIGLSFIYPKKLVMKKNSKIDHFSVGIHLDEIVVGENSTIGRSNWITGFPTNTNSKHFSHQKNRKSQLIIGNDSAITKNHHLDCTNILKIGNFVTIAGYKSQFLTHSINIVNNKQDSFPIEIGDYCFISTGVKILGGSCLPSYSVLAAGSVLNKIYHDEFTLYGGVPARPLKQFTKEEKYFSRSRGFVY